MNDTRTTAEILADDPDAIILEACPPEEATISLAGIVNCDPLTRPIVDALAAGHELPEEFLILDTYADCGWPPAVARLQAIRQEVRDTMNFFGLPMPTTRTLLDRQAGLEESLVSAGCI
jgi:hypothetical protein